MCSARSFRLALCLATLTASVNCLFVRDNVEGTEADPLTKALEVVENTASKELRDLVHSKSSEELSERLPALLGALPRAKKELELKLKQEEKRLREMIGGDTPSLELHSLMTTFVSIFNEQWNGQQLPTRELTKSQIETIQAKYFGKNAVGFAQELVESWREHGDSEFQDTGFDRRLVEVANMLRYDSATQLLTYSSHFWLHLTNMYMLLVRSIKDLLDPRDLARVSNIGNVGRTGADKCNAAVIEAKHAFRKGTSEKGMKFMQYGVKFIVEKHMQAAHDLFANLPSVQEYINDVELMLQVRQAQAAFVEEVSQKFLSEYEKFLYMVVTNVQQPKIIKMLNTMSNEQDQKGAAVAMQAVKITACSQVAGSEKSRSVQFPMCKCEDYKAAVFCGTEAIRNAQGQKQRKFNTSEVMEHPACKYAAPYCSSVAQQHQLVDLAKILNPKPDNCDKLYDELVDSSIDILVNNVGSLMYYLAYDSPDAPIVKRSGLTMQLVETIKGEGLVSESLLQAKFPALGQKQRLMESVVKQKNGIRDFSTVLSYLHSAAVSARK